MASRVVSKQVGRALPLVFFSLVPFAVAAPATPVLAPKAEASVAKPSAPETPIPPPKAQSPVAKPSAPTVPIIRPSAGEFWPSEAPLLPKPSVHLINSKGEVRDGKNVHVASRWVWAVATKEPVIRTWIVMAEKDVRVISAKTSTAGAAVVTGKAAKKFLPKGFLYISGQSVVVDSPTLETNLEISVVSVRDKKAKDVFSARVHNTAVGSQWADLSCEQMGLKISAPVKARQFLYVAARCVRRSGKTMLTFFYSNDLTATSAQIADHKKEIKELKSGTALPSLLRTDPTRRKPRWVAKIGFNDSKGPGPLEYQVFAAPDRSPERRVTGSVGMGFTYFNYLEPAQGIHSSGINFTPKLGVAFSLLPKRIYLDLSGFATLVPIYQVPQGLSKAWYYGANARLAFNLPIPGPITWSLQAGWYFWGMFVQGRAYGINYATGPQVLLALKARDYARYRWSVYFRYGPLTDALLGLSLNNRELAGGFSLGLGASIAERPLSLTVDVSHFKFTSSDGLNGVDLATASLGLAMPLQKPMK